MNQSNIDRIKIIVVKRSSEFMKNFINLKHVNTRQKIIL